MACKQDVDRWDHEPWAVVQQRQLSEVRARLQRRHNFPIDQDVERAAFDDVEHVPAVALATTTCYGGRYHRYAQRGTHLLDHLLASANHLAAHGSDDLIYLSLFNRRQQEV